MTIISQEASYAVQQSLSKVKSPKTSINEKKFSLDSQLMWFLLYKTQNLCLKINFKQFAQIFGNLTLVKLCWAA